MVNGKGKDTMKTGCKECYADNNQATPLLNPEENVCIIIANMCATAVADVSVQT